jgi:methylenetetrahydrofolate dehydrogenase (NADP+)/methenyltetrahydrofolate cyclohydrolase
MAKIIDGKKISAEIKTELIEEVNQLKIKNIIPKLALLLVGNNPASEIYVNSKHKLCNEIGIISLVEKQPENITENEVLTIINK